ncbi:MAG TPA: hypothetical protein VIU11_17295 [Nakamurella sp.]
MILVLVSAMAASGCASSTSPNVASASAASASPSVQTSPTASTPASSSDAADWPTLLAALAEADGRLSTAQDEGWWAGPVCSPDIEQHREQAGQSPLSDEQLRAECAANIGEFRASGDDYDDLQALDESVRAAELTRVAMVLGLPAGQQPTIGQIVVVHGCEQGWITDQAVCAGIPAG